MVKCWPKEEFTGENPGTQTHITCWQLYTVFRRREPTKTKFEEILKNVRSEAKLELDPAFCAAPGKGWKTESKNVEQSLVALVHHEIGSDDPETP